MYCTMFCNLECILEANDSDLLTHLLSYPHSRDAIASKNIGLLKSILRYIPIQNTKNVLSIFADFLPTEREGIS